MSGAITVGVIANPMSGRDVRRLLASASVFNNAEKARMVLRLLAGLGAAGVERVWMMPAGGLTAGVFRLLDGLRVPDVTLVEMPLRGDARDTAEAAARMAGAGVAALLVIGGDGTHRVAAKHCGGIPLCALPAGTNNAFAGPREATAAGLAAGLFATRPDLASCVRREKLLEVSIGGRAAVDCALVDVAVVPRAPIGARALLRLADVAEFVATFADPCCVGLAGVAGLFDSVPRSSPQALHVRLDHASRRNGSALAAFAPGLLVSAAAREVRRIEPQETVRIAPGVEGCVALDGERDIEFGARDEIEVRLTAGPRTIDVDAVLRRAAEKHFPQKEGIS
jgi:hypothetical protein